MAIVCLSAYSSEEDDLEHAYHIVQWTQPYKIEIESVA
jgi:hypothetical protein